MSNSNDEGKFEIISDAARAHKTPMWRRVLYEAVLGSVLISGIASGREITSEGDNAQVTLPPGTRDEDSPPFATPGHQDEDDTHRLTPGSLYTRHTPPLFGDRYEPGEPWLTPAPSMRQPQLSYSFGAPAQSYTQQTTSDIIPAIVNKIGIDLASVAIETCFVFLGHVLWAALFARKGLRKTLTPDDEKAFAHLDELLGEEHTWVRDAVPDPPLDLQAPITEDEVLAHLPQVSESKWEEVGKIVFHNANKSIHVFLCGKHNSVSASGKELVTWIARRTKEALFRDASNEVFQYIAAGIATAIARQGLEKFCGENEG